ncbi:hypothetical protein CJF42_26305, partial [Pseudoalteromonas sp. NBT06-2]|uniref:hypothetical protein n=1 Tax=Pseudoalteromonas sp. NBT06-2 TaxID=2025950 RepID=UPI000BCFB5E7
KTETCSLERLQLFIERGNTAHIEAAAGRVANGQKWQYFDEYHNYLSKLTAINDYNANLPIIGKDEHDIDIYASPKTIPDEPEAMPEYTGSKVLAPYLVNLFKADRQDKMQRAKVIINSGKTFDADEKSITRLNNAINAARNEISDFIIEWSTADVDTGVMVPCTKAELEEAHTKAVQNMG